jgi:type I restriction enzyme R subunit
VQGFTWKNLEYTFKDEDLGTTDNIVVELDETTYLILVKRYKELFAPGPGVGPGEVPYDIEGYITTIDTDKIDSDYMNSRFEKYMKILNIGGDNADDLKKAEEELHKTFATLSQEEQKFANIFLHDIQSGDIEVVPGKTFKEYVIEYCSRAKDDQIHRLAFYALGLNEAMLREMMAQHVTEDNINEFGRFDALKATVDKNRARAYFEGITGQKLPIPKVNVRVDKLLRDFILQGGFDIEMLE